jgi:hypothetical protein
MGRGATATLERLAASLGELNEAGPRFAAALDIAKGGVLLALPALLVSGLLRHAGDYFRLPKGFYGLKTLASVFLTFNLLAFAFHTAAWLAVLAWRAAVAACGATYRFF